VARVTPFRFRDAQSRRNDKNPAPRSASSRGKPYARSTPGWVRLTPPELEAPTKFAMPPWMRHVLP